MKNRRPLLGLEGVSKQTPLGDLEQAKRTQRALKEHPHVPEEHPISFESHTIAPNRRPTNAQERPKSVWSYLYTHFNLRIRGDHVGFP